MELGLDGKVVLVTGASKGIGLADLSDAVAAAEMIDRVELSLGTVDILVNSAGAAQRAPADELTPAAWRKAFDAKFFPASTRSIHW